MTWTDWCGPDMKNMEAQFNPRISIGPDTGLWLARWADTAVLRKNELGGQFDLAYGDHPLMRFDLHPGCADLPIIINIHGGYWRALNKADMNHHMADLSQAGFGVVNMDYPLCPEVSLTKILACLDTGISAVLSELDKAGLRQKLVLMGHSAGAHMAMHLSHHPELAGRLAGIAALSGIYQTELVLKLSVNDDVRLTKSEAARWNCLTHMPATGPAYYIAVGGGEPSGWIDQSWMMADALRQRGDNVVFHGCGSQHHFSVVDCLCNGNDTDGARMQSWIAEL